MNNYLYVAVLNYGSEGYSAPLRAFASCQLAKTYQTGAQDAYGSSIEIWRMPISDLEEKPEKVS
jgi:hypothetical protein